MAMEPLQYFLKNFFAVSLFAGKLSSGRRLKIAKMIEKAFKTKSSKKFSKILKKTFKSIKDKHGYILSSAAMKKRMKPGANVKFTPFVTSIPAKEMEIPIIYVKIPPLDLYDDTASYEQYASDAIDAIKRLRKEHKKFNAIVDFRQNRGGLIRKMFQVLGHITKHISIEWMNKRTKFNVFYDPRSSELIAEGSRLKISPPEREPDKIAILIDSDTASAGEMCAISLCSRKDKRKYFENRKIFGSKSYGVPTYISGLTGKFGSLVGIGSAVSVDISGLVYDSKIIPDVFTKTPLHAAIKWCRK
jgi:hypothetical protein